MRTLTIPRVPLSSANRLPASRAGLAGASLVAIMLNAVILAAPPAPVAAQVVTVGGVAGLARSRQILERASDSDPSDGFVAGAWMDVATPLPLLHVLAEAGYARRGGRFPLSGPAGLTGLTGTVASDWITFTTVPLLHVAAGPVAEGLSAALSGSAGDIRQRSYEVLVRVGKRRQGPSAPMGTTEMPSSRR